MFHLGERSYDHVLLLPTKAKGRFLEIFYILIVLVPHTNLGTALGPNLTPNILLDFINAKGSILVAVSSRTTVSSSLVSLLLELDIHLPPDRTGLVVDHFNYDVNSASEKHDVLLLPTPGPIRQGVVDFFSGKSPESGRIAFPNGVGQTLGQGPLLAPILRAPSTSYSYNPKEQGEAVDDLWAAGSQLALVRACPYVILLQHELVQGRQDFTAPTSQCLIIKARLRADQREGKEPRTHFTTTSVRPQQSTPSCLLRWNISQVLRDWMDFSVFPGDSG